VDQVYGLIAGQTRTEAEELGTAPGEPGMTRALPYASVNEISGLVERLNEGVAGKADLYTLAADLHESIKHILPSVEAAELLGFATVESGDLSLTPLGQAFAEAGIQSRKELFAGRIRRIPIISWILNMLTAADIHRIERDVLETALALEFPPDEVKHQLDTALDWGRYSELFSYDKVDASLFIEDESSITA
jgi:NitT/TauT family transport system ATP-binding protein